jgi:hypothetical protein
VDAARAGQDLDPQKARYAGMVEYEVPDRAGDSKDELIALVTTITDLRHAPAPAPALRPPITRGGCDTKSLGASGTRRRRTG